MSKETENKPVTTTSFSSILCVYRQHPSDCEITSASDVSVRYIRYLFLHSFRVCLQPDLENIEINIFAEFVVYFKFEKLIYDVPRHLIQVHFHFDVHVMI